MPFSMADILAGYATDPENPIPVDAPGAGVTPAGVLQAFGHVLAPGLVSSPFTDRIGPQGSAFTPAPTARDYATQLSAGRNKPPDPLETMLGVAGGEPAMFIAPGRVPGGPAAVARFNKAVAGGMTEEEARQLTGVNLNVARKPEMEISDAGSTFRMPTPEEIERGGTVGTFMSNWKPAEYVPELNRMRVTFKDSTFEDRPQSLGFLDLQTTPPTVGLNPANLNTPEKMRDALLHEASHGTDLLFGNPAGGSPFDPKTIARAEKTVRARKADYEKTLSDVSQRAADWSIEQAGGDRNAAAPFIEKYFQNNPDEAALMKSALMDRAKFNRGRMKLEEQFKIYQGEAGEEKARVVQKSKDKTQEELLRGPSPEARSDLPFAQQFISPQKARQWSTELPSFSERMAGARDVAFAGRQRGTGNILPRETTYEAPLLAPGETRGDLVGALTPGMEPAERSIADIGRDAYRGFEPPGPPSISDIGQRSYRERLGLGRQESTRLPGAEIIDPETFSRRFILERDRTPANAPADYGIAPEPQQSVREQLGGIVRPTTEMTPIGEQYVLPGAEALTPAQMAQRKAAESLKAKVPQQEPGGLFDQPQGEQGKMFLIKPSDVLEGYSMGDVTGPGMGVGAPYLRNPNAPLFDYARLGERVPTPQFNLTRTESTNVQPEYLRAGRAANIARVNKIVEQGIKEGGLDWHNMLPLLERYQEELGTQPGRGAFNTYMDRVGATSPNSNVMQNFRTASYYDYLLRNGLPLPELLTSPKGNPFIAPGAIPYPYGNKAQGLHVMNLQGLESGEGYPLSRPKPPSFAENMKGNYLPVAIDRHNLKLWGVNRPEGANLTGYRFLEDLQQQQAARMGIDPAQYQAAGWLPYADSGAVPALKLFEQRIANTAEAAGLTKEQVLREFIRAKMPLQ